MSSPHRSPLDPTLEEILKLWTDFNASLDPQEVYSKACKAAVELTGSDRSKFVRFDSDFAYGTVCKEYTRESLSAYPYWRPAMHRRIRIQGVPEEQPLFAGEIVQHDDVRILSPGVFKDNLTDLGIKSILIAPVRWKDSILGSFSIEGVEREKIFSARDVQLCQLIADAVAQALENSRIYKRECYRRELLGRLDASRTQLMGARDELELRKRVQDLAQQLCGWKASALFRYVEPTNTLQFLPNQLSADAASVSLEDSNHWLVREVLEQTKRTPAILRRPEHAQTFARDHLLAPFQRAVVLRITRFGKLDSAVLLLDDSAERDFEDTELEYLTEFSARAVTAIEREEGWNAVEQKLVRLMLPLLGPTPVTESGLERRLYRFLTIVTAGFGLRFNRAAVLLLNENRDALIPRFAIGQFDQHEWRERCEADAKDDADKLEKWLSGAYTEPYSTPLEGWARQEPAFSLRDPETEVFARGLQEPALILATQEERQALPLRLREKWKSSSPVVLVRLHDDVDAIGVLVADNEFTRRPVNEDLAILQMFCRLAAQTIAHQQRVEEINALFKRMSNIKLEEPFSSLTTMQVLQRIVDEVEKAFGASAAGILTIDEHGAAKIQHASHLEWFSPLDVLQWRDVWTQIDKAALSKVAEDEEIHPALRGRGIHSVIYLPLSQHGRCIGTLVVLQTRASDARRFGATTVQRYADEASQVYNSWFALHFLRDLETAVQGMIEQVSRGKAVDGMLRAAKELFNAKLLTFWPYDVRSDAFLPMERLGFDDELPYPRENGHTRRILRDGYHAIPNVRLAKAELQPRTFEFLLEKKQGSVQSIAIGPENDRLGVLYLTYDEPRDFSYGAKQRLDAFGRNVAPILQSVRALDSGRELLAAAEEVSRVLALGHEMQVLSSVAARTRSSVRCYSVTIFTLDECGLPNFPPASVEGADMTAIVAHDREDADELIPKLMQSREMTIARNAEEVRSIFGTKFVAREQIQTTFAAPLFSHNRPAGILFASFRNELPEREIEPVKNLISHFGNQAAVAIGNAARFRALESLSSTLLSEEPQKGVFSVVAQFLMNELQPTHCTIVMRENRQLRVVAQAGWSPALFKEVIEEDSHAGFTIHKEEPNHFEDVHKAMRDPSFANFHAPQRMLDAGIVSGLAVPLRFGNTVHGAILLHSTRPRNFDDEDALFVGLVANEAMSAHRSMTMLRRSLAQYRVAEAIAKASQTRNAEGGPEWRDALDPESVLNETLQVCLESLTDGAGQPKASAGSIEIREPKLVTASIEPDIGVAASESIVEDLSDGPRLMGRIELRNYANRVFDEDDRSLVRNIATLLTLFARQMEEQDRVLKNLATTTHDYQRCDDAIKKTALLLEDADSFSDSHRESLTYIKDALLRLEDHHEKMIYTVKVLTGQLGRKLKSYSAKEVHSLLRKCGDRFTDKAAINEVKFTVLDAPSELGRKRVEMDEELLAVVFNNLLANALKFSREGQSVTCSLRVHGSQLRIDFTDQGPGIKEPAKIFDPWYQAKEHQTYQTKSFGVGLFISKRIIQMHRGNLTVETPVFSGYGSRFIVTLPLDGSAVHA